MRPMRRCFPILQDRIGIAAILALAFLGVPLTLPDFWISAVLIPILVFFARRRRAQPAHGLCRTDLARHRGVHGGRRLCVLQAHHDLSGRERHSPHCGVRTGGGCARRIVWAAVASHQGFYLAVATLAAQFFLSWCFVRVPWLYNYNVSGAIEVPTRTMLASRSPGPTPRRRRAISSRWRLSWA